MNFVDLWRAWGNAFAGFASAAQARDASTWGIGNDRNREIDERVRVFFVSYFRSADSEYYSRYRESLGVRLELSCPYIRA